MSEIQGPESIVRVLFMPDNKGVNVYTIGKPIPDRAKDGDYESADVLPEWMQERLAVLRIMPAPPPLEAYEGVGSRLGEDVFWLDPNDPPNKTG